jgi:hypothetical protein
MTRGGWSTWRWPVVIGMVTLAGLLLALLVGGVAGSVAGWIGLAVPSAALIAGLWRRRR